MRTVALARPDDFAGWRDAARALAGAGVPPEMVAWRVDGEAGDLLAGPDTPLPAPGAPGALTVPRRFIELAQTAVQHRDPERFALLYTLLWRFQHDRALLDDAADPLVHRLAAMVKSVRRDAHKMHAFVRFRHMAEGDRYVAWFEPEHHIVRAEAGFFQRRFAQMRWSILTPEECAHWDGEALSFTPGATRADAPDGDELEETWRTYYASIFNPARVKVDAMLREMPKKYWRNMPETALVPGLIAGAQAREQMMIERSVPARAATGVDPARLAADGTAKAVHPLQPLAFGDGPGAPQLAEVAELARACTRCPLYAPATQTVFGEGPADARLMFVGEQPGDQEDLAGHPFVGPAGQVFDRALAQAGIERRDTYVTNAVKHFKFEQRGKRRIHSKPGPQEIEACRWWIEQEQALIKPMVIVALGATAARSLFRRVVTIGKERGRPHALGGAEAWITVHPSFLLRVEDKALAEVEFGRFVEDLVTVRDRVAALAA